MIRRRAVPAEVRRESRASSDERTSTASGGANQALEPYVDPSEHLFGDEVRDVAERDREIGRRAHALVVGFCQAGVVPDPTQVWVAAAKVFADSPVAINHGARQRAACSVSAYFVRFHRPGWSFAGVELDAGTKQAHLAWETPSGVVVIDELSSGGIGEVVDDRAALAQVERSCQAGLMQWGERFAGVRLLPLAAPGRALFCPPDAVRVPLRDAPEEVR